MKKILVLATAFLAVGIFSMSANAEGLKSVEDIEKERAMLGFLGLAADVATNGEFSDVLNSLDPRHPDRDRDYRRPGRRPGPGYPGYRPYPPPRYPGYRPYPPPRYPSRGYYVCYASNARGMTFSGTDYNASWAQDEAMRNCYSQSRFCEARGCSYY